MLLGAVDGVRSTIPFVSRYSDIRQSHDFDEEVQTNRLVYNRTETPRKACPEDLGADTCTVEDGSQVQEGRCL